MSVKNSIKHVCFDLDGTLINSYNTILKTTIKTLDELKLESDFKEEDFYNRIGHHFADIFSDLNIPVPDIEHFINIYKGHYFDFIKDSDVYPSVMETLKSLKQKNIKISLLTTKGQDQADKIIDVFEMRDYFDLVMGRRIGLKIKPDPEPLLFICNELNVKPEETIMVGDSELDVRCGYSAGAKTCSVTFGYRTKEALQKENPDYIVDTLKEILSYV
ncbi:MAG TPA: HAD-IA family hydrolase [Ignavibacteriaceae bacterium]|nr:HAD-IA family hydrolase [Ignavibacteriaceae bacterium]